jgi:hypothetical protein
MVTDQIQFYGDLDAYRRALPAYEKIVGLVQECLEGLGLTHEQSLFYANQLADDIYEVE